MHRNITTLSLDTGKCPQWLFLRMKKLAGIMAEIIIEEFGHSEFLKKLANPYWFQAFGCALAFDWNSSGLTITTTAALKSALKERRLGIYVCGGKGKTSKKTPQELTFLGEKLGFDPSIYIKYSKLIAKIDNSLIQDGFNIYHHSFIFSEKGDFCVIQQGMNTDYNLARRYQWYIDNFVKDLTTEPHTGIISDIIMKRVLNLTAKESSDNKKLMVELINNFQNLLKDVNYLINKIPSKKLFLPDIEFKYHPVLEEKFDINRLKKTINKANFLQPQTIEDLLLIEGIGPKTIRALSLIGELIYNKPVSKIDPVRYTFVHGGKDGTPYPVDRKTYDETIQILQKALKIAKQNKIFI